MSNLAFHKFTLNEIRYNRTANKNQPINMKKMVKQIKMEINDVEEKKDANQLELL